MENSQQEVAAVTTLQNIADGAAITVTQCQRNGYFAIFTTWNTLQWTALYAHKKALDRLEAGQFTVRGFYLPVLSRSALLAFGVHCTCWGIGKDGDFLVP
ncbi:hypothetical protein E4U40_006323, partial [Claviceps sp. LM458 group G5]